MRPARPAAFDSPLYPRRAYNEHAQDDRGEVIRPLKPAQLGQHLGRDSHRYQALKGRLSRLISCDKPPIPGRRFGAHHIIPVLAAVLMLGEILLVALTPLTGDGLFMAICLTFGLACVGGWYVRRPELDTINAMTLVAEGVCGQCAFSLEGLAPEEDACLVCPECGAAWDHRRLTRPLWEPCEEPPKAKHDPRPDVRGGCVLHNTHRWTVDDAARCVHTIHPRFRDLTPEVRSQRDADQWRDLTQGLRHRGRIARLLALLAGCAGAASGFVFLVIPNFDRTPIASSIVACLMLLVLIVALALWRSTMGVSPSFIAHALTRHGCCGSCANDLMKTPANANAVRVCELCRASWLDARFPRPDDTQGDSAVTSTPPAS